MRTFTDRTGRQWTLDLTMAAAKRMRSLAGVDLLSDDQSKLFDLLGGGGLAAYETICDCLFACIKPEADKRDVSDEQFGSELGAEQMAKAAEVFVEELIDFFRGLRPPLAEAMRVLWAKAQASRSKQAEIASRAMQRPEIDEAIEEAMQEAERQLDEIFGRLCTK